MLHYSNYEESEIRGVYTEDAMREEMAQYAEFGRKKNEKAIAYQKHRIDTLMLQRKSLGQEDRKIQKKQSELKNVIEKTTEIIQLKKTMRSRRKKIVRQMSQLAISIGQERDKLEKMHTLTDEQLAEQELRDSHLYFEEFYVIDDRLAKNQTIEEHRA